MCLQSRMDVNSWLSLTALAFNLKRTVTLQKQSLPPSLLNRRHLSDSDSGSFYHHSYFPVQKWIDKVSNFKTMVCVLYAHSHWGQEKYACSFYLSQYKPFAYWKGESFIVSLKILLCKKKSPSGIDWIVKSLTSSWRKMVEKEGSVISNEN